jgi:thiol-disulfide isomerase/thioredoxin
LAWVFALPAAAAERQTYDAAALAAAQKAGKSVVVHITAPWCPTCKAQKPTVEKLAADPEFKDLVIFDLDFDTGREALIALKARSQSTFIAFKGEKETARSVGDTNPDSIAALFKSAL